MERIREELRLWRNNNYPSEKVNQWCNDKLLIINKLVNKFQHVLTVSKDQPSSGLIALLKDIK